MKQLTKLKNKLLEYGNKLGLIIGDLIQNIVTTIIGIIILVILLRILADYNRQVAIEIAER
jgi:hypothetical protein